MDKPRLNLIRSTSVRWMIHCQTIINIPCPHCMGCHEDVGVVAKCAVFLGWRLANRTALEPSTGDTAPTAAVAPDVVALALNTRKWMAKARWVLRLPSSGKTPTVIPTALAKFKVSWLGRKPQRQGIEPTSLGPNPRGTSLVLGQKTTSEENPLQLMQL